MSRHAIINKDNIVVNVIIWEGNSWTPPQDHYVVHCVDGKCDMGDSYDKVTNTFSRNN